MQILRLFSTRELAVQNSKSYPCIIVKNLGEDIRKLKFTQHMIFVFRKEFLTWFVIEYYIRNLLKCPFWMKWADKMSNKRFKEEIYNVNKYIPPWDANCFNISPTLNNGNDMKMKWQIQLKILSNKQTTIWKHKMTQRNTIFIIFFLLFSKDKFDTFYVLYKIIIITRAVLFCKEK